MMPLMREGNSGPMRCGWIAPDMRTNDQNNAHRAAHAAMPRFGIVGKKEDDPTKVCLWELWKHPMVVSALGYAYPGTHQLTGSCFPCGTPVRLANGNETAIEAVQVGDEVITHTGQRRRVIDTMTRLYSGDLVTIHVRGFSFPLEMTADHQVATLPSRCGWRWRPGGIEWKRADEVEEGDRVLIGWDRTGNAPALLDVAELLGDRALVLDDLMGGQAVPVSNVDMAKWVVKRSGIDWRGKVKLVRSRCTKALNRHIPLCPSLARLIGLYLAEGGCDNGKVVFTFAGDEEALCGEVLALAKGLFGADGTTFISNDHGTARKVVFGNSTFAAVFKALIPGNVYSKRVPGAFFGASSEIKAALILGWMHGDGYEAISKRGLRIQGVTASSGLARDITTLALSCGMRASVSRRKARGRSRTAFNVYLAGQKATALFPAMADAGRAAGIKELKTDTNATQFGYARAVKRIERRAVESFRVFDFEVEEDHSFLAGGLTVHNCVGAGGGNVIFTVCCVDAIKNKDPERIIMPFWLLPYGRSRFYLGDRSPGEGSTGGTFAKAVREDGCPDNALSGLPRPNNSDGLVWGSNVERSWSDGDAAQTMNLLPESRKHLIQTTAQCRNADEVREAIRNYYPCTCASSWGGLMRCEVKGTPEVLMSRRADSWNHQMSIQAWWDHPTLGEIFWIQNQWGLAKHGSDPSGGPGGGFWVSKADVDWICRDGNEVYAFSQYQGYPAQSFTWSI